MKWVTLAEMAKNGKIVIVVKNKQMKNLINKYLVKKSIRPYKLVALSTGVIVEHYRNGKLKTEYYGLV